MKKRLEVESQVKKKTKNTNSNRGWIYLGVEAHCILGGFVEFWVLQHVLLPAGALEYAQSERR